MNKAKNNAEQYIQNGNMEKAEEEYKKALDIAEKYKLPEEQDLDDDYKDTGIVIDGDKALDGKKYEDALDKYVLALEKAGDAENIERSYVLKKMDLAKQAIKIADLLTLGDKQVENADLDGALGNYLQAKDLAIDANLKDEKKEAMDKIQKIYDQKGADAKQKKADDDKAAADAKQAADDQKKQQDDAAKKAEDDKKAAKDSEAKAIDLRKNGDLKYTAGDYVSAKMYYALAKEAFEQANDNSLADELVEKIALMDKKINETSDKKSEADKYKAEADKKYSAGDTSSAKVLYLLAKDVYSSLGDADDVTKVTEKIAAIDQVTAKAQPTAK